jgi:hypothetical protein
MKFKFIKWITPAILVACTLVLACEKEKEIIAPWDEAGTDANFARLRIVHASPNFRNLTGVPDSINIFANGQKINGARLSFGGLFPGQTPAPYVAIPPGAYDIKITVGGVVNTDSIPVATLKFNLAANTNYSFIITDSVFRAVRDSSRIFVRDSFPAPSTGRIGLRFVNAMTDTAIVNPRVDVWSARRNNNLYTNINPGATTSFTNQPFIALGDTLIVRRAGTLTEVARLNNITFADTKVYTLYLRGDAMLTTGVKARTLTWYSNR